jgi:branched-chain amino acid transport system permease protein
MLEYAVVVLTLSFTYGILATSLNVPFGFGGIYNAAQGALFGAGAYAAALTSLLWTSSFLATTAVAMSVAAVAGAVLIVPAARARHEYFMITSLGLQVVAATYFVNADYLGGNDGLPGIPLATIFGLTLKSRLDYFALATAGLVASVVLTYLFRHSRYGRALAAVGSSEEAAKSLGVNPLLQRSIGLIVSGAIAGLAGSIYTFTIGFINPDSFGLSISILIFTMVILGGAGTILGPVLGAIVLTVIPAVLTFVRVVPAGQSGALQQVIYGLLLVVMVVFRPEGLVGHRRAPRRSPQRVGAPSSSEERGA